MSLATHFASQIKVECRLQVRVVTLSLHSYCHCYCLESSVLQVLPHCSSVLYLGRGEVVTSEVELKKWHLKLYCLCHYLAAYLQFSFSFFSIVVIKISATDLVAAKGFQTYSFQTMSSNKSMKLSFTHVAGWLTD